MNIITIFLGFVILLLAGVVVYALYTRSVLKRRVEREAREAGEVSHKVFDLLAEDIQEQVESIENTKTKQELKEEEGAVIKQLKKHLDGAEQFIKKEIEDIEKEVR